MSVGAPELLILVLIATVLFGPTLLAFWLGYTVGKKRSAATPPAAAPQAVPDAGPAEPDTPKATASEEGKPVPSEFPESNGEPPDSKPGTSSEEAGGE